MFRCTLMRLTWHHNKTEVGKSNKQSSIHELRQRLFLWLLPSSSNPTQVKQYIIGGYNNKYPHNAID